MVVKQDCIFCKIVSGQLPSVRIYEDDNVLAFMDVNPVSFGHTLLIPKSHYDKLADCPSDILAAVSLVLGRLAGAVSRAVAADGYNVLCNNGRAAGQLVDHVHFHIIPRMTGDGVFNSWPSFSYEDGIAEQLAEKICAEL
ncbi:MAG: HIT family protein [Anaerohalosphaeraceae bacterium]|nr:HIT family protein [Anaerohalosphaeraceae bacterium]